MKFNIDAGHTLNGGDTGASGINGILEQNLTRQLLRRVADILTTKGHQYYNCTVDNTVNGQRGLSNSINMRINNCNLHEVDFNIILHFNCSNGQGQGSEIFTWNADKIPEAVRILDNFEKIGLRNRGIKANNGLGLIKGTKSPTLYIEVLFIDNQHDYDILATKGLDILADAIVAGILNEPFTLDKPKQRGIKQIVKEMRGLCDELERLM